MNRKKKKKNEIDKKKQQQIAKNWQEYLKFVHLNKKVAKDPGLSLAAKGFWVFCLANAENPLPFNEIAQAHNVTEKYLADLIEELQSKHVASINKEENTFTIYQFPEWETINANS